MDPQSIQASADAAFQAHPLHAAFVTAVIAAPLVGLLPMAWGWRQLARFLQARPRLSAEADLKAFKALARDQMILALVQIGVLASPWVLFGIGLALGVLQVHESIFSTGSFVVVLAGGLALRLVEKRVQAVPAATPELEAARNRVVHTWMTKPLPDWDD